MIERAMMTRKWRDVGNGVSCKKKIRQVVIFKSINEQETTEERDASIKQSQQQ